MTSRFKKYFLGITLSGIAFISAVSARADLPAGNPVTIDDVSGLIGLVANFLIITSMVLAVIFIVLSGIMIMLAQSNPTAFTKGLTRLKHAIYGVAVVLATGVIINTVAALVDRSFFCQVRLLGICLLK